MTDVALSPFHLAPRGRGRASPLPLWERSAAQQPGEGCRRCAILLSAQEFQPPSVGTATLTRPFGATSPIEGEVRTRVRGETLRSPIREITT